MTEPAPNADRLHAFLLQRTPNRRRSLARLQPLDPALLDLIEPRLNTPSHDRLADLPHAALAIVAVLARHHLGLPIDDNLARWLARDLELFEDTDLSTSARAIAALDADRRASLLGDALDRGLPRAFFALSAAADLPDLLQRAIQALARFDADRPDMPPFACAFARVGPTLAPHAADALRDPDTPPFTRATLLDAAAIAGLDLDPQLAANRTFDPHPHTRAAATRLLYALNPEPLPPLLPTTIHTFLCALRDLAEDHPVRRARAAHDLPPDPRAALHDALDDLAADIDATLPALDDARLLVGATDWFLRGNDAAHRFIWESAIKPCREHPLTPAALVEALIRRPASAAHVRSLTWLLRALGAEATAPLPLLLQAPDRDDRLLLYELAAAHPDHLPAAVFEQGLKEDCKRTRSLCRNALRWRKPD